MDEKNFFKDVLLKSLLHCVLTLLSFIFLTPFNVWRKSVLTTAEQRENGSLKMGTIKGFWPFLSYMKRILCDFLFDAFIVLSYPLGIIAAFISFKEGFLGFITVLAGVYFLPITFALTRDFIQLTLIPFRKFLSWGAKPAQFMDLNVNKKDIK